MRWRISWQKKRWGCKCVHLLKMQSQLVEGERLLLIFCCPEICKADSESTITKESFEGTIDEHLYVWHRP